MKLYKSDGKIFADLNETIELYDICMTDSLESYKSELLKKTSDRFDRTVAEAALKGMEKD